VGGIISLWWAASFRYGGRHHLVMMGGLDRNQQLKTIQQTVSSDQAETKRLSAQVNALSVKLEALQQSFASAQQAPAPVVPIEPEPAKPKPGAR
jgi:hypothetical protein